MAEIATSDGVAAPVTATRMMEALAVSSTAAIAAGVRELRALGLVVTTESPKRSTVFAVSDGWRALVDITEAKAVALAARAQKKRHVMRIGVRVDGRKRKPAEAIAAPEEGRGRAAAPGKAGHAADDPMAKPSRDRAAGGKSVKHFPAEVSMIGRKRPRFQRLE